MRPEVTLSTKQAPTRLHEGLRAVRRNAIAKLLRSVFGVERLREGQQRVIDSVLDGKDTLAIMPTGSGKSLCYQIPAKLFEGVTLVVSPLISLMRDQLDKLHELGVRATQVNSSLSADEEHAALEAIRRRRVEIVFCTPERLAQADFLDVLRAIDIALVVIDEAHCISQWGHDFRPAYVEMAASIEALGRPPLLALTATATDDVVEDIGKQLGRTHLNVINTGIYRPNLHYSVVQVTNPREKIDAALRIVRDANGCGIIYAATVKAAEEMHQALLGAGESAAIYHGKLPARERRQNQDLFMAGERRVMVATNAFGMGIDKRDTRFVLHLQLPANLESYYQESGRAGRDGKDAWCTLLFLQDDKRVQQFFLVKHYPDARELKAVYRAARELMDEGPVIFERIHEKVGKLAANKVRVCLKLLKDGGLLRQNRALAFLRTSAEPRAALFDDLSRAYAAKQERDREALEQMVAYAVSGFCRWKMLLDYFGDSLPGFDQCGRCDNCLDPPAALAEVTIRDDEFERASVAADSGAATSRFAAGDRVRVARFGVGTVQNVAGDEVTIEFAGHGSHTFMAGFVEPA
jgi:ATP-dependent DNA helicase RecQ